MNKVKKERNTLLRKGQSYFVYRDESNKFNLSFQNQNLDKKFLIGNYLIRIRVELARLSRKNVAENAGISVRNLLNVEKGDGVSMDAIMKVYFFYVYMGILSSEEQGQFSNLCRGIWTGE